MHMTPLTRIVLVVGLFALAGCGTGSMIVWNPRTGESDEVPKAAAYAIGGAFFAARQGLGGAEGWTAASGYAWRDIAR
jgi:hypothetical protein